MSVFGVLCRRVALSQCLCIHMCVCLCLIKSATHLRICDRFSLGVSRIEVSLYASTVLVCGSVLLCVRTSPPRLSVIVCWGLSRRQSVSSYPWSLTLLQTRTPLSIRNKLVYRVFRRPHNKSTKVLDYLRSPSPRTP